MPSRHQHARLYECGICGAFHPCGFRGDCRDDTNRYGGPEDYADRHRVKARQVEIVDESDDTPRNRGRKWARSC